MIILFQAVDLITLVIIKYLLPMTQFQILL